MPRPRATFPSYCLHKATGQAVVTINGRDVYLGEHDTAASRAAYERVILEWKQQGTTPRTRPVADGLTVRALFAAYWRFIEAQGLYEKHGKPTTERACISAAARPLVRLFGDKPAAGFGPLDLQVVRGAIAKPVRVPEPVPVPPPEPGEKKKRKRTLPDMLCRGTVNKHVHRVRRMFRWAVSQELLPASVWQALLSVPALRRGAKNVRDRDPVRAVTRADVDAVLPKLSPQLRGVVELMWNCGCRPGEALQIRLMDVDKTASVWTYVPASHKTEHMGHARVIPLGPRAQAALQPFLKADPAAYLFDPRDEVKSRRKRKQPRDTAADSERRNARLQPAELLGAECNDRYRVDVFGKAVVRACKAAKVDKWTPNQLRHSAATRIRAEFGLEAASVILGHSNLSTTQIYAEADKLRAIEIAAQVG
jgi:integrase